MENENIQINKLEIEIENTGHITNTYLLKDKATNKVVVIDPSFDSDRIIQKIDEMGGILESIVVTHSHADHIAALATLAKKVEKVYVHELDKEGLYDAVLNEQEVVNTKVLPVDNSKVIAVKDNDEIKIGNTVLKVIHTPGHTKGSMVVVDEINNIMFSGDTIFERTYGRTDLATGSHDDMENSLEKLFNRFEDIWVMPGHESEFNLKNSKKIIRLIFAYKG